MHGSGSYTGRYTGLDGLGLLALRLLSHYMPNGISHHSGARVKLEGAGVRDNSTQRAVTFKGTEEQIAQAKSLIEACPALGYLRPGCCIHYMPTEISHRSGARVKLEGGGVRDNSTQRAITFKGTGEQIAQAKSLIEACVSLLGGARVKLEGGGVRDNSTQRAVTFKGTEEQIAQAKSLIEACVAQEKCRREIEQSKRSPRHNLPPQSPVSSEPTSVHSTHSTDDFPGEAKRTATANGVSKYKRTETAGASIEVYVSAVSSPSRFWVQLVGPQVAQLDELVANMTDYYGRAENRENHKLKNVSIGQIVAAVFRHDGRWYRARVHDIRPNEFDPTQQVADVFYVDYGDSEYVATHELCELRADLLRLRFQAMECFLAGVKPAGNEEETVGVTASGQRWEKWHPQAVERFEELTQVARWKALTSRTCTYKKTASGDGDKEKEIPGIKLFDVSEEGELDIGGALISEGWAVATAVSSPRTSPPPAQAPPTPTTPFGDLGNSMVLGMLKEKEKSPRASSLPKDHKDEKAEYDHRFPQPGDKENKRLSTSKSHASGLEKDIKEPPTSVSNFDMSYPTGGDKPHVNGATKDFLAAETKSTGSTDTLTPKVSHHIEELKANMNRIDSHHKLEDLGKL
ncbi:tudor domain-containing protein [Phthorimaea operculella]|nr:tudor domain-containing protein [Phthorimaea operculella]